jgi:hypothetical protein
VAAHVAYSVSRRMGSLGYVADVVAFLASDDGRCRRATDQCIGAP